jgi:hypothetical protein
MEAVTAHCRNLAVQIVLAVQAGMMAQSSPEHILALKVAHEGFGTLSPKEQHHYTNFIEPILEEVEVDQMKLGKTPIPPRAVRRDTRHRLASI